MKTTLDLIDILWTLINGSALKTALVSGGGIYKHERPLNSNNEDVVINSLPIINQDLQVAICNVNIHVPDKTINVTGGQQIVADHVRLKALSTVAVGVLDKNWGDDYNFSVQQQTVMADETPGSHFINIRIEFFNINISN
ncbi:MAG: hypothetical protein ABIT05_01390 [Chitinophagaceae bacterium]